MFAKDVVQLVVGARADTPRLKLPMMVVFQVFADPLLGMALEAGVALLTSLSSLAKVGQNVTKFINAKEVVMLQRLVFHVPFTLNVQAIVPFILQLMTVDAYSNTVTVVMLHVPFSTND